MIYINRASASIKFSIAITIREFTNKYINIWINKCHCPVLTATRLYWKTKSVTSPL